jgi:hypothetical protein
VWSVEPSCWVSRPLSPSREFSFAIHQIQQAIDPNLSGANALFGESGCTVSRGKVTQAITSIGEMASVVNAAPRPTD